MVKLYNNKFVIEIESTEPAWEVDLMRAALAATLERLFILNDFNGFDLFQLNNIMKLIKELEYDPDEFVQMTNKGCFKKSEKDEITRT